jgi:hypothetical protein
MISRSPPALPPLRVDGVADLHVIARHSRRRLLTRAAVGYQLQVRSLAGPRRGLADIVEHVRLSAHKVSARVLRVAVRKLARRRLVAVVLDDHGARPVRAPVDGAAEL